MAQPDYSEFTLLIAEDNDANFSYANIGLKRTRINVIRAKNGLEAVEMCKTNPDINIIFMDGMMPEMSGFQASKNIRTFRPDLPIILITAFFSSATILESIAGGCNDYIAKPVSPEVLLAILKKYLPLPE